MISLLTRNSSTDKGEGALEKKLTRCNPPPVVDFLPRKAKADQKLRQQELEVKKKELENSQGMMQRMMQQQQPRQMNQTFLAIAGTAERFLYWGEGWGLAIGRASCIM